MSAIVFCGSGAGGLEDAKTIAVIRMEVFLDKRQMLGDKSATRNSTHVNVELAITYCRGYPATTH